MRGIDNTETASSAWQQRSQTGSTAVDISDLDLTKINEFNVTVKAGNNAFTFSIIPLNLTTNVIYYTDGYYSGNSKSLLLVGASTSSVSINQVWIDGSNVTSTSTLIVSYR